MMKLKISMFSAALALLPALAISQVPEGQPAPKVSMKLLKDGVVSDFPGWEAYRGKVVVLEMWATWCAPCVADIPRMNDLQKALEGKPVAFISVTTESAAVIKKFQKTHPMSAAVAVDGASADSAFGTGRLPQTVLISKTGIVLRYTQPEEISGKKLIQLLDTGSVSGIKRVVPDKDADKNAANPPLFEVQVTSVSDNAKSGYGGGTGNRQVTIDYSGLPLRTLLALVYGVSVPMVEISSGIPQRKFNFVVRVPEEAESAAKPLLKEAIKAAYRAEMRSVKKEMRVLVLRYSVDSPHAGLLPAPEGGMRGEGSGLIRANGATLGYLSETLAADLAIPVIDETGLGGTYDMDLKWKAGDKDSLSAALKERFGMTLTPASREVEILEVFPQPVPRPADPK
jgi:uncharacterized protein (TIGR03435 family)